MQSSPSLPRPLSPPSVSVPWRRVERERGELRYVLLSDTGSQLGAWVKAHGKVVSGSLYRVSA